MAAFARNSVVLVRFPFSDLSQYKLRPAITIADCQLGDRLLCQITSKPYSDPQAVQISDDDFETGTLRLTSYARPAKLFTAHRSLIIKEVGILHDASLNRIIATIIQLLRSGN